MTKRTVVVRSVLLILILAFSAFLFNIGKGHTLLLDTNALTFEGKELTSADTVSVSVDGREPEEMARAERLIVDNLMGASHRVAIEVLSGEDKKIETSFSIPASLDSAVLRLAAILRGAPESTWVEPFTETKQEESAVERTVQQEDKDVIQLKKP